MCPSDQSRRLLWRSSMGNAVSSATVGPYKESHTQCKQVVITGGEEVQSKVSYQSKREQKRKGDSDQTHSMWPP